MRRAALGREVAFVQRRPYGRIFLWRSDVLKWLQGNLLPAIPPAKIDLRTHKKLSLDEFAGLET